MAGNSLWTDALVSEITELWKTESAGSIARIINDRHSLTLTRNSVIGKLHRLGLTDKKEARPLDGLPKAKRKRERRPRVRGLKNRVTTRVELGCVPLNPMHLTFDDIGPAQCRYPYGDGPFTFCGHPTRAGYSFCTAHHSICWEPARSKVKASA
jgi:GcrA cell cycle regulator